MATEPIQDAVNHLTPIERELVHVHPRLYFTREAIEDLKGKLEADPWAHFLADLRLAADSGDLANRIFLYLLTGEREVYDSALQTLRQTMENPGDAFRTTFNLAVAYDWLYGELDEETLVALRGLLNQRGRQGYEELALYEVYPASTYGWNIFADDFCNTAAAGAALFGDVPNVGPWLRFVLEKTRTVTTALGADGVSPEGICYGGFFTENYAKTAVLVRDLLGWDFLADNAYLQNVRNFYVYSMLPLSRLGLPQGEAASRWVHLPFADSVRYNWYGPDTFLRLAASIYRDPVAQWAAKVQNDRGTAARISTFLNFAWYDPGVDSEPPDGLPTTHHFADKDVVTMRSGWDGDESMATFKCGPHAGHHALRNYPQCIGGGHMHPDAGAIMVYAHGDYLLCDTGYTRKFTAYRNTIVVNGIGQTGEPDGDGDWFECTELRREKRAPRLLRVDIGGDMDYLIGDVAPAYELEAGLQKFLRHVLYLKPDCWVLVDELVCGETSTFDLYFHSHGAQHGADHPFVPGSESTWTTGGDNGKLQVTALAPDDVQGFAELQAIDGIGAHQSREITALRLRNGTPAVEAVFVTVLQAYPAGGRPEYSASAENGASGRVLVLSGAHGTRRFHLVPGREDPAAVALEAEG